METVYIVESGSIQERVHSPAAYTNKHKNAKEIRVITNDSPLFVAQEIIKIKLTAPEKSKKENDEERKKTKPLFWFCA